DGLGEVSDGLTVFSFLEVCNTPAVVGVFNHGVEPCVYFTVRIHFKIHRLCLNQFTEIGDGFVEVFLLTVSNSSVVVSFSSKSRLERNRLSEIGNGFVELAKSDIRKCPLSVVVVFRVELDSLGEVGNCVPKLALLVVALAPPKKGVRQLRVKPNGLAEVGNRPVELSFFPQAHAAFPVLNSRRRANTEKLREETHGCCHLSSLEAMRANAPAQQRRPRCETCFAKKPMVVAT